MQRITDAICVCDGNSKRSCLSFNCIVDNELNMQIGEKAIKGTIDLTIK